MNNKSIKKYYSDLISKHGNNWSIAGWGSKKSQEARFSIFCEHFKISGKNILDVGCGRGDFFGYLHNINNIPKSYTGIDIMKESIEFGKENYVDANFVHGDLLQIGDSLPSVDYAVSSGVFNLTTVRHWQWMSNMTKAMFIKSKIGVAINVISTSSPIHKPGFFYAEPSEFLEMGRKITPYVILRHDYAAHDVTLFLFHSSTSSSD